MNRINTPSSSSARSAALLGGAKRRLRRSVSDAPAADREQRALEALPLTVPRDRELAASALPGATVGAELLTPLARYLRDAVEVPLLTVEEEVALARRIRRGDAAAREQMIRANLRLVVKIARDYEDYGLPLLDVINEGNIGLMKAVERFDPAKGGKLSTYAAWWIKQSIRRALNQQSKIIRVPTHTFEQLTEIRRVNARYESQLGRSPTPRELSKATGIRLHRLAEISSAAQAPISLEAPLGDLDSSALKDVVADVNQADPAAELARRDIHQLIEELVQHLPERERIILEHRFALGEARKITLRTIGRRFGVTRERIRQLQNIALAKLRKLITEREVFRAAAAPTTPLASAA